MFAGLQEPARSVAGQEPDQVPAGRRGRLGDARAALGLVQSGKSSTE